MRTVPIAITLCLAAGVASPMRATALPDDAQPSVRAERTSTPIAVDGRLDDEAWRRPPAFTGMTQSDPFEGAAPTESTWVWVAYDDDALYIAVRCWDSHPDSIYANLARRDVAVANVPNDRVTVNLDPFHDHRSGYFFSLSAAGTLFDGTISNDVSTPDGSWDGVWEGRSRRDEQGWACEMRIPFSQMRFRPGPDQVWGINVRRRIERRAESDQMAIIPRNGSGYASRFLHLTGLENLTRSRTVELRPYTTGKAEYLAHEADDPFHDGSRYTPGLGADLRMSVGNNLTLNATANPDFGQVEVDPAVVNLSDVESYFGEKRPFFTENSRVFSFGSEGANRYWGFGWPEPRFFYSRRIGRTPQGRAPGGAEFSDVPVAVRILGAAKLTGKPSPSLSFGTLHAVTAREEARYMADGLTGRATVEPLTYYGVARGLKEMKGGGNGLGIMTTLVQRRFDGTGLDGSLNEQSLMAGLDGWHFLDRGKLWVLSGWAGMSRVAGTQARMVALQRDPRHYLQRPDAKHLGVDSSATSLVGYGARVGLNKQEGNLISNSAIGYLDPKFDVNDMGFQSRADLLSAHTGLQYRFTRPNRWWREFSIGSVVVGSSNRDGDITGGGLWQGNNLTFPSDWTLNTELMLVPLTMNTRRTRGGPLMEEPAGTFASVYVSTSARKALIYSLYADRTYTPAAGRTDYYSLSPAVEWKPVSNLSVSLGPNFQRAIEDAQYVRKVLAPGEVPTDFGDYRYVFARMDQTTVSADLRFNVSFTTNLTLQVYVQPLISAGHYTDLKELARAGSYEFVRYGGRYDSATGIVTPEGGTPFTVSDPDFNYKSMRGNAVLRWEYRPGSEFYLVWTQARSDEESLGDLRLGRSTRRLLDARADDVFLVKATYHLDL